MAKKNNTIILDDDGMKAAELSVLSEVFGTEKAKQIAENVSTEEFDTEVQEILDDVLPLDEM